MQNKPNKRTTISFSRTLVLGLLVIAISGCLLATKPPEIQDVPEDVPMSEFFLGCWASIEAYDDDGQENDHKFMLLVMDENTLDFVWFNSEGFFQDHTISEYWFIDINKIYIDNKRILGGEY